MKLPGAGRWFLKEHFHGDGRAVFIEKTDEIAAYAAAEANAGDVILVISNGGFGGVQERILRLLEEKEAGNKSHGPIG